jgi:predicted NBD/HSP70 family sugar kinase
MIAVGLDIGGTKIETQVFDTDWSVQRANRVKTPTTYGALIDAITEQIDATAGNDPSVPVGIGCAGLLNPETGVAFTANLPATGHKLIDDICDRVPQQAVWINDCRAMTLSEAVFGAGRDGQTVVGLILGTGIGGGVAVNGKLLPGWSGTGGEFGHISAPAHLVQANELSIHTCGCGKIGCIETYIAGPGLTRLVRAVSGQDLTPLEIAEARTQDEGVANAWALWCDLVGDLIVTISHNVDPDIVVLGGGLSKIANVTDDLQKAVSAAQFPGYRVPEIRLAEGGDASGARGAAFQAYSVGAQMGEAR